MLTAKQVADYLLSLVEEETGELISNLKIQKLVYYAQGFYLAMYEKPLFNESIEAWTHGPVIPTLYQEYKKYNAGPIPRPSDLNMDLYSDEVKNLLNDIYSVYGQYSAWRLREMTHEEHPWLDHSKDKSVIPHNELASFFKNYITQ